MREPNHQRKETNGRTNATHFNKSERAYIKPFHFAEKYKSSRPWYGARGGQQPAQIMPRRGEKQRSYGSATRTKKRTGGDRVHIRAENIRVRPRPTLLPIRKGFLWYGIFIADKF
jgi:hypothetical protein